MAGLWRLSCGESSSKRRHPASQGPVARCPASAASRRTNLHRQRGLDRRGSHPLTTAVIDSSVAVKWFVPEVLSEQAAHLLDGSWELVAPDLLFPECGN